MTTNEWLHQNAIGAISMDTYFNKMYGLDNANVLALANEIISPHWTTGSIFSNPTDWISSIVWYPFDINFAGSQEKGLMIGPVESTVNAVELNAGLTYFDLGYCKIDRYFNNFADYNGYTKISVWLPYLGFIEVTPNDVMGRYLRFKLKVDLKSGQGIYYVGVSNSSDTPDGEIRILSTHSVTLGYQIPLGSTNTAEVIRNIINGTVKAMGAVTAGYVIGQVTPSETVTKTKTTNYDVYGRSTKKGSRLKQVKAGSITETTATTNDFSGYNINKAVNGVFESSINSLTGMHASATSDRVNNPASLLNGSLSIQVVIIRPRLVTVKDTGYDRLYGRPLGRVKQLSELRGYTELDEYHIEGLAFNTMTTEERALLDMSLSQGIIL